MRICVAYSPGIGTSASATRRDDAARPQILRQRSCWNFKTKRTPQPNEKCVTIAASVDRAR
jgi:hypothetical protein